ncbi:hypothetical protein GPECTOR_20g488 [Gonium pectorale]|uniref:Uncharacterized protein n=1 Tax=Gonium pectorale TaxID=33097 RepID=A0A150GIJ3_GONPE|nr:hypothetical protein GPECTOR_20g488 [Gonium pectorale]|eukprot:KXZ49631.1 hypothetical protein GPECTOR_20g488 [Gonium pectorale]
MDRQRHSRSVSRSRREERRSGSIRSSHESMAGNLSPGRHHEHPGHRRGAREGGFFKNLFGGGRRDKRAQQQLPEHASPYPPPQQAYPGDSTPPPMPAPAPPRSASPAAKFKALLSFAPHSPKRNQQSPSANQHPPADEMQVKDLQHRMQLMQVQVQDYERLKAQLAVEQRAAQDWKEKWNYQNFKLNLMVDMLVLRVLELDQPAGGAGAR